MTRQLKPFTVFCLCVGFQEYHAFEKIHVISLVQAFDQQKEQNHYDMTPLRLPY